MSFFALIHSPLVGLLTWKSVAQNLEEARHPTVIPALYDDGQSPFWPQHVTSAANAIHEQGVADTCILVGHSGAGPLLPLIGAALNIPVSAYIFVDAGLPQAASRLDMLKTEIPAQAADFETFLQNGGHYPQWQDADLHPLIPDATLRRQMLAELKPRALAFFTEPIPTPPGWDTVPCGYIQLSPGYAVPASLARQKGWPVIEFQTGHFHMLVHPSAVASTLLQLMEDMLP